MKYGSLKRQAVKSLKLPKIDGGINLKNAVTNIENNQLSDSDNMWFQNSYLQTRPGLKGDKKRAVKTQIYGYTGELEYKMTDTEVYYDDMYHRIATADVLTDDYAHYTYVYLIDLYGNIKPIGNMSFLRLTSDVFYTPVNILFYTGKSETGGGIFALVTLQNGWNTSQRYYYIYEIDETYSEWNKIFDYYVPTIYINGRGNCYDTARSENSFSAPAPKTLESPNMLNGRFNAYYTSDGHSNSFRLPFSNLAKESVICRIYYSLLDFVEWKIESDATKDTQKFQDQDVTATIDRTKGTVYFTVGTKDFAVPIMSKYHENNIKITATKEIVDGFSKVVYSTCCVRNNSKLLLGGGKNGNTIVVTSYENPLYFPQNSCTNVGDVDAEITALSVQKGKILAFKNHEIYALDFKFGDNINEISLLSDNDRIFKKADKMTVSQIAKGIGCENKKSLVVCGNVNFWLGTDNCIYALDSVSSQKIINVCEMLSDKMPKYNISKTFAVGNEKYYYLINGEKIIVIDIEKMALYIWTVPNEISLESGFYHNAKFRFLAVSPDSTIAYITTLEGEKDIYMFYDGNGNICEAEKTIENSMTTKYFCPMNMGEKMNVDNMYLSLSATSKAQITVNSNELAEINFGFLGEEYNKNEHKIIRITPHLFGVKQVFFSVKSKDFMSIGEAEISYRITG